MLQGAGGMGSSAGQAGGSRTEMAGDQRPLGLSLHSRVAADHASSLKASGASGAGASAMREALAWKYVGAGC